VHIVDRGVLSPAEPAGDRRATVYPTVTPLRDGTLLATCVVGASKDDDGQTIELRRSRDGRTWSAPERPFRSEVEGRRGSLGSGYLTHLEGDHLVAVGVWVDREAHPGKPLFNGETEGTLPMRNLVAHSTDLGRTWSPWRAVPVPADLGPAAATDPILRLADGRLVLSSEVGKHYDDRSKWFQRVIYQYSDDQGRSWGPPRTTCQDPTGRIFNWDQRVGVAPDGRVVTFTWTYDHDAARYLNIHRRLSRDGGATWSEPGDLGFADQPSHPAILSDGSVVLAWVDRFGSRSIRARRAECLDGPFLESSEVVLYELTRARGSGNGFETTGELLSDLHLWTFGLPYAAALPGGDVMVTYYAGDPGALAAYWVRLAP
jgi:hypothetical protein